MKVWNVLCGLAALCIADPARAQIVVAAPGTGVIVLETPGIVRTKPKQTCEALFRHTKYANRKHSVANYILSEKTTGQVADFSRPGSSTAPVEYHKVRCTIVLPPDKGAHSDNPVRGVTLVSPSSR